MSLLHRSNSKGSSRSQMGIEGVKDNVLILPGNRYRVAIATSSVNFELRSEQEQDALVDTYQAFLNSLTMPVQILVRIRELDVERYLEELKASRADENQEVYHKQLAHYSKFIRELVSDNKILSRRFYIIIPHDSKAEDFELVKEHLAIKQEIVMKGLERLGMAGRQLTSLEILDLFYSFYQPGRAKTQPLTQELIRQTNAASHI